MTDLAKGKAVSMTGGFSSRAMVLPYRALPRFLYYKLVIGMFG
jgi:hypothetical protein